MREQTAADVIMILKESLNRPIIVAEEYKRDERIQQFISESEIAGQIRRLIDDWENHSPVFDPI